LGLPLDILPVAAGAVLMGCGLYLLSITIQLFVNIGQGTLAPWSPTKKLVLLGPYKYVRNPMISGVLMALLGETCVFGSIGLLLWAVAFFVINHIYFIFSEEPGLEKRFGEEYLRYRQNVPRWIPRLKPWTEQNVN
jgi:protein-S-isoprenylcysteine O-methyltransferase Ste14